MTRPNEDFDDPIRTVGADATAGFDSGPSNPTEHAGSEALGVIEGNENEDSAVESDDEVEPQELDEQTDDEDLDDEGLDGEELLQEDEQELPEGGTV